MTMIYTGLDAAAVTLARRERRNVSGTPASLVTAAGGEPVRCCLGNAIAGEELMLVSVDLGLPTSSPYAGSSPVYLHPRKGCTVGARRGYPSAWFGRPQVLRGYDARGWIVAAAQHDGHDPERAIAELLDEPQVTRVLSCNVLHGCFMLAAERAAPSPRSTAEVRG